MKHFKRFTSAVLTIAVIAGAGHAANFRQSSAQVSGEAVMYSSVIDNWEQLIAEEKQKFPDRSYWNHKGISSDKPNQPHQECHKKAWKIKDIGKRFSSDKMQKTSIYSN